MNIININQTFAQLLKDGTIAIKIKGLERMTVHDAIVNSLTSHLADMEDILFDRKLTNDQKITLLMSYFLNLAGPPPAPVV